jgi:hypothetical protein
VPLVPVVDAVHEVRRDRRLVVAELLEGPRGEIIRFFTHSILA